MGEVLRGFRGFLIVCGVIAAFHYLPIDNAIEASFLGVVLLLTWIEQDLHKRLPETED